MTSLRYPYVIRTVIRRTSAVHPEFIRRISARHPHGAPRQPYIYAVVLHSRDLRTCDGFSDGRCMAGIWPSRKDKSGILQVARATPHMHSGKSPPSLASSNVRYPYDIRISVRHPYDIHAYIRRNIHRNIHRTSHLHPTYIPLTSAFLDVRCPPLWPWRLHVAT